MIYEIIKILSIQVSDYTGITIELDNVSDADQNGANGASKKTMVTMVNYDEEGTMRNIPNQRIVGGKMHTQQPTVSLNLFLLFSSTKTDYIEGLKDISKIIEYFQSHRVFTQSNTIFPREESDFDSITDFKFHIDLHSISFEDLNYIWGSLGGKQYPSALYKLRVVHIDKDNTINQSGLITETVQTANNLTQNGDNQPI